MGAPAPRAQPGRKGLRRAPQYLQRRVLLHSVELPFYKSLVRYSTLPVWPIISFSIILTTYNIHTSYSKSCACTVHQHAWGELREDCKVGISGVGGDTGSPVLEGASGVDRLRSSLEAPTLSSEPQGVIVYSTFVRGVPSPIELCFDQNKNTGYCTVLGPYIVMNPEPIGGGGARPQHCARVSLPTQGHWRRGWCCNWW